MDDADIADEKQEEILRRRIAYLSAAQMEALPTGRCLNCDAILEGGRRWCDHDCMTDWKRRNK